MKVELTLEQINLIECYIMVTTNHRKKEREAWEELAKLTKDDGTPEIPVAKGNAQWYTELDPRLDEIMNVLRNAR